SGAPTTSTGRRTAGRACGAAPCCTTPSNVADERRRNRASHKWRSVLSSGERRHPGGSTPMPLFPKPAEGSWTEHSPDLGTGPVSYEDSISPDVYERERDAIFSRTWLNVGRVEQLPRVGAYLTKEIDAAPTSVVV